MPSFLKQPNLQMRAIMLQPRLTLLFIAFLACGDDDGDHPPPGPADRQNDGPFADPAYPEVSAINAYSSQSYEFKSICEGATGTLNVAIYFRSGFSPSNYLPFAW